MGYQQVVSELDEEEEEKAEEHSLNKAANSTA